MTLSPRSAVRYRARGEQSHLTLIRSASAECSIRFLDSLRLDGRSLKFMHAFLGSRWRRPRRFVVVVFALAAFIIATRTFAQTPPPTVSVSFGIDTTTTDVGDIVRLVRAYLAKP